jgi:hypothetical protein
MLTALLSPQGRGQRAQPLPAREELRVSGGAAAARGIVPRPIRKRGDLGQTPSDEQSESIARRRGAVGGHGQVPHGHGDPVGDVLGTPASAVGRLRLRMHLVLVLRVSKRRRGIGGRNCDNCYSDHAKKKRLISSLCLPVAVATVKTGIAADTPRWADDLGDGLQPIRLLAAGSSPSATASHLRVAA